MATGKAGDWNEQLEIPGRVRFMEGVGDLPMVSVTTEWSSAEIYLHGAHVTHFQKTREAPLLYLSQVSRFEAGQPIRGGIPVILPWFGGRAGLPAHGFARTQPWDLREITTARDGGVVLHFQLISKGGSAGFPAFVADYVITVRDTLSLELTVTNAAAKESLEFEECLHTYFAVGDIASAAIAGLQGVRYLDKVDNFAEKQETAEAIQISSEVDRVYLNTTGPVEIHDANLKRKIRVEKEHSASTVVWNPWIAKAQQMADFGNDDYQKMVLRGVGQRGKESGQAAARGEKFKTGCSKNFQRAAVNTFPKGKNMNSRGCNPRRRFQIFTSPEGVAQCSESSVDGATPSGSLHD